jgi:homeobox protein cut-like
VVAKLAEMDMVVADLERANTRAATVERRNVNNFHFLFDAVSISWIPKELLRAEIESLKTGNDKSDR